MLKQESLQISYAEPICWQLICETHTQAINVPVKILFFLKFLQGLTSLEAFLLALNPGLGCCLGKCAVCYSRVVLPSFATVGSYIVYNMAIYKESSPLPSPFGNPSTFTPPKQTRPQSTPTKRVFCNYTMSSTVSRVRQIVAQQLDIDEKRVCPYQSIPDHSIHG